MFDSFIDRIPLWLLFIIAMAIVLLAIELGYFLGRYRKQRSHEEENSSITAVVGATLGLLAFLLAFTFGMSATRFDSRKQNVLLEANAIGTTYLRADFLPAETQDKIRNLIREYTVLRTGGASVITSSDGLAKSSALLDQIWANASSVNASANTFSYGIFIQSLNEMIDLNETRLTGLRNRIPDPIWTMLFIVTFFSMIAVGYELGLNGSRNWVVTILLAVVFSTVLVLIADLDRASAGALQVSQQPLIDLLNSIGTPTP